MDRLSKPLKTTLMAINTPLDSPRFREREQQQRNRDRELRDHYQGRFRQFKNFRPRLRDSNRDNCRNNYRDNNRNKQRPRNKVSK